MLKALPLTAELTQSPVLSTTISTGSVFPMSPILCFKAQSRYWSPRNKVA
jgi:hypothetical protein